MDKDSLFKQVLAENKDKIYRICCAYETDSDERDDLYQQIMINIWKSLDKFEGRSALSTWIYRVAVNTSLMHVKSAVRRKSFTAPIDDNTAVAQDNSDTEEKIKTHEMTQKLYTCINMLAEMDRLIISMVLEDVSYKEISEVTGITVNNVGVKINRIKKALSNMMTSNNIETEDAGKEYVNGN